MKLDHLNGNPMSPGKIAIEVIILNMIIYSVYVCLEGVGVVGWVYLSFF